MDVLDHWILGMPRFFADLKRRRVFRMMAVYGAGSFAMLEAISLLQPVIPIPDALYMVAGHLAIVGFPVTLVLTWLYDYEREKGVVRTPPASSEELDAIVRMPRAGRWAAGIVALAGIVLLGASTWSVVAPAGEPGVAPASHAPPTPPAAPAALARPAPATTRDAPVVVAVLPFANRSAAAEDVFFIDGLHDDILVSLSEYARLRVVSRTSVLRFRDTQLPLGAVADSLGATAIVEGAVQRVGGTLRVSMQLIDARTDEHLWADAWDGEGGDENLLSLQEQVAGRVARAVERILLTDDGG